MAGIAHYHRIPFVHRVDQSLEGSGWIRQSLKSEVSGGLGDALLTAGQSLVGIPHAEISFLLQEVSGDVVVAVGVDDHLHRNARTRRIRPDLPLIIAIVLVTSG